jgi:hypothetical protein
MLSRVSSRLIAGSGCWARQLSTTGRVLEDEMAKASKEYASKVADISNAEPSFPSDFLQGAKVGSRDGPSPSKIKLSLFAPHKIYMKDREVRALFCAYDIKFLATKAGNSVDDE